MNAFPIARQARLLLPILAVALPLAGCDGLLTLRPIPTGEAGPAGTALPPATAATKAPATAAAASPAAATAMTGATASATVAAAEPPTATARAALPLPGTRLDEAGWRTVVQASGLADMGAATELGPNSHFVVATGNGALNTLRAELLQPANAWLNGLPADTVLLGAFLGLRRGDGHSIEILDLAVEDSTVHVAVRAVAPGEWLGSETVFPLHLVAVARSALPAGPLVFRFVDADALGAGETALFDVPLEAVQSGEDELRRQETLLLQAANEGTPEPAPSP